MAGIRRRYNLEKLISENKVPVVHELPAEINVNQLKWGLRGKLESLNAIQLEGQDMVSVANYPMVKEQMERLESLLEQEISELKNEIMKIYQSQANQKSEWSMIEVERQKEQEEREAELTEELQDKWQNVLEKINDFPQAIEEQLQLQQSVFVQEISGIIAELAVLRQDKEQREKKQEEREVQLTKELQDKWQEVLGKIDAFPKGIEEQLQLQQSMFMQEISTIISELVVLQQDKEQRAREQMAVEIRHLMDEMEFHMLEEAERQKDQEERESQLTKELQDKWQDVLGRIEVFPQGVEDQLQLQQSMFMQEFSRIISELAVLQQDKEEREREQTAGNNAGWDVAKEVRHLIDEMGAHMLEEGQWQKKREERESQLTGELQDKWQDVLGRIEAVPQGVEEQLQLQQNVLLQEISKIISELAVLQQDKEEREKEQAAGNNAGWNVVEEVRHLIDEMGVHMLGEVEWQRKQEEREVELTKELQDKWQEILGKIDVFPQGIEEQLKLQQSVFMQEFSKIISELTVLQQDKEQREREQTTEDNAKWNVAEEIRHLMDEIKIHMLEESNRQKKKEERETELTKELQNKWQDVLGKIDGFPQAIEEQLQPQQNIFMPEISTIISELVDLRQDKEQREREQIAAEIRHLMDKMEIHMLEEVERQKEQEERDSQLKKELRDKWQDVLGKIDAFPQGIEEQLQMHQSVFMPEIATIISELAVLRQEKEQREREQIAEDNMGWNVVEIRHLMDEIKIHMLEEVEWQKKQEESESQLTNELQNKWQEVLGKIECFPEAIEEQLQRQQSVFVQEISKIISELTALQQDKEQWEREQIAEDNAKWNITEDIRYLIDEMKIHLLEEVNQQKKQEEREMQLTKELQNKWQDALEKIDAFPQVMEEHLELQQNVFMQDVAKKIEGIPQTIEEQLQLQQNVFIQDVSGKIEGIPQAIKEQLQLEQGVLMQDVAKKIEGIPQAIKEQLQLQQSVFMQDVSGKIEGIPQAIKEQLQLEQSVFMQDVSGKIEGIPQAIKEQLQLEQNVFMQDVSGKIEGIPQAIKEQLQLEQGVLMQDVAKKIEGIPQAIKEQLQLQQSVFMQDDLELQQNVFMQDVSGKIEGIPQAIKEQLQLEQSVFMQDVSGKIEGIPQAIKEQLQLEQGVLMQDVAKKIEGIPQAIKEQLQLEQSVLMQDVAKKIEGIPQAIEEQLQLQQNVFIQDVSGKIECIPQAIKEQLQLEQSVFMQDVSGKIEGIPQAIKEQLQLEQGVLMQDVAKKIEGIPQAIEEQLQLQQNVFMQDVSGKIEGIPQAIKEQLQLEQSVFMQDVSGKIEGIPQTIEEQLQLQQTVFIQDVSGKIEGIPQAIKEQLQLEQSVFMQDVSGKIEGIPQAIKEQLQLEQNVFMQDVSGKIEGIPQAIKEQLQLEQSVLMQDVAKKIEGIPQTIEEQLQLQQTVFIQDVSGKIECIPQAIEEQLQLQQNIFMQEFSKITSEVAALQQDKEQQEREEQAGENVKSNVAEEVRHLKDEMGTIRHMLEEVAGCSRRLTEILQQKDVISKEILLLKVELTALRKAQEQANQQIEQQQVNEQIEEYSSEELATCPQTIVEQLLQQGNMVNHEILSLKEELAVITQLHAKKLRRRKRHH
ncbi:hypothetical protein [Pelosinus sp. UFO1]|uniref:hypothetical protein n=1 Tax=Pelosinus sp. UFO1 TaxID=484770 RepID=UPI0004D0CD17|nr:hypothetical protein [Pelosinus sp. UFO1]AIF52462.1 hypothetical protein UFO1_2919 [Pelosinus sp. UFO1]